MRLSIIFYLCIFCFCISHAFMSVWISVAILFTVFRTT